MTQTTGTQKLASLLLGQNVEDWIAARRADGESWRGIRDQLAQATNGQVDVTHATVRNWLPRLDSNQEPAGSPSDYSNGYPSGGAA